MARRPTASTPTLSLALMQRFKARGELREPLQLRKGLRWRPKGLRRPSGLAVGYPGAPAQVDTKQVVGEGKVVHQFGAVDYSTLERVVALAPWLTSAQGAASVWRVVRECAFPVEAVRSDGGAEFLKEFGSRVKEPKLIYCFGRPNYPLGSGCIERSF